MSYHPITSLTITDHSHKALFNFVMSQTKKPTISYYLTTEMTMTEQHTITYYLIRYNRWWGFFTNQVMGSEAELPDYLYSALHQGDARLVVFSTYKNVSQLSGQVRNAITRRSNIVQYSIHTKVKLISRYLATAKVSDDFGDAVINCLFRIFY